MGGLDNKCKQTEAYRMVSTTRWVIFPRSFEPFMKMCHFISLGLFCLNGLPFLYLTKIFPIPTWVKGINISLIVQEIIQIYDGFVNPVAVGVIKWKYHKVYLCILAVELILVYPTFPRYLS